MATQLELLVVPFPVPGHLLVTFELAKRLIHHDRRIHSITIFQWALPFDPHAQELAESLAAPEPRIRLAALPEIPDPPSESLQEAPEAYIIKFVKKLAPLVRDAVSAIVSSRDASDSVRVAGLLLDFFCAPLIDVGNSLNLPSYIFLTCNTEFLCMMKYLSERHRNITSEFDRSSGDELLSIPGYINSVPTKVLPKSLFTRAGYDAFVEIGEKFTDVKGILVNSFTELEPHAFDFFRHLENYPRITPVGPIVSMKGRPNQNLELAERDHIMKWLDEQPNSSVVFLCFGSFGIHNELQLKEIAQALELVDYRFLWSIRSNPKEKTSPKDLLPEGFLDRAAGRGMVCDWAPQVEVLGHKSIGGFVSHCGWNSILESLWFGVPIATWPMYAEQQLNAFAMAKEIGLAVDLRVDYYSGNGELVTAEEIVKAVESLMDGGDERRVKVKEMAEAARKAVMDGGSSIVAMESFVDELVSNA